MNAVERTEKTKDSRLARELVVALPIELQNEQWIELISEYVYCNFVKEGMCADVAIHDTDGHNPHAHIMLTVRPLDNKGKWQYKTEKEYLCKRNGEEIGFTAAELLQAKAQGWEKQYQYYVGKKKLDNALYDYFASLELPDQPTIYDYLVLSLTKKDVIATFNWDPLLIQAYVRCHRITNNLPHILCLHGNVAMGYCYEHDEFGTTEATCPICKRVFAPTKLLYPVKEKDYDNDNYIKKCWEAMDFCLEHSYMLTIFGYSAPSSDKQAVSLLKKAWGSLDDRQLEEVSVIDIIDEESMLEKWKDFIYSHHYRYTNDFYSSYLGTFPRRTCETIFATFQLCLPPYDNRGFNEGMTWNDIKSFLQPLLKEESDTPKGKGYPLHYHDQ